MQTGTPYSKLISFNDGFPDGAVVWVLRDISGAQITTASFTPPVGAVSGVILVPAPSNTLSPSDPLRTTRDLSWEYITGGQVRAGRERYFVEGVIPFPVSEGGVRNLLGAPEHNLPDQEIDLISAYWRIQDEGGSDLLEAFEGVDGPESTIIAQGIEAKAALALLPTMSLRLASKEASATDSYTRFSTDWEKIEATLQQTVLAALEVISGTASFVAGDIFQLTQPVDRFNPG